MAEYRTNPDSLNVSPSPQTVTGILERVTYHNEENGYTVGRIAVEGANDLVTVTGSFTNPVVGELLVCEGRWVAHREYGRQFTIDRYTTARPATSYAIEKYLGSGLIRGVGPVMARRMVEMFQTETLDVIDHDPEKLLRVEGIGAKRVAMIRKAWHEQREIRNVMIYLQDKGVSSTFAVKIYKRYGDNSIQVVEEDPYRLAADIRGIGFKTADKIAQQIGIEVDSPRRIEAGLLYTLSEATDSGHMFLPEKELSDAACEILGVEPVAIEPVLTEMVAGEKVKTEQVGITPEKPVLAIYHPALYFTEVALARDITRRNGLPVMPQISTAKVEQWLAMLSEQGGAELSDEQKQAVAGSLGNTLYVLTGGPGTGKTLTTNTIVRAFEARKRRVLLVSPTGRAAKRLSEVTGREAQTIHRLLKFDPASREFFYNAANQLDCDAVIVDEVSMLDCVLANSLLRAIPDNAQIVFVGDSDQLPSVGAGNVLSDLLDSGVILSTELTRVFRQAESSLIVTNAHRIRNGVSPLLIPPAQRAGNNCIFVEIEDSQSADLADEDQSSSERGALKVVNLVRKTLPALGFNGESAQVLSPMHRGAIGVGRLNELLQDSLNPNDPRKDTPELIRGSRRFRVGDRVIQIVNNYDKSIFNGDIGTIRSINHADQIFGVQFGDNVVPYDFADYDELQLAYAISVHKSQGSEYRAVVLVIHSSQYMMLQRNLLYTGLTRARELCIIVGDRRAIARAVRNNKTVRRHTWLAARVKQGVTSPKGG